MRIWMLAAGAAALAITAPALADPKGGGQGGGKGGKGQSAQVERGGGQTKARGGGDRGRKGQLAQGERRGGEQRQLKSDRGQGKQSLAQAQRDERRAAKALRVEDRGDRGRGRGQDDVRVVRAGKADRDVVRVVDDDIVIRRAFDRDLFPGRGRGLIAGCPPGLFKKNNGCMPPGQVNHLLGTRIGRTAFANSLLPYQYRNWFRDDDDYFFRAGDGFIYRVDRDDGLIDGIIPLMTGGYGGYYALGDPWPSPYNFYNVPYQYRSTWFDRGDDCYRYDGWGAIYRVDCDTQVVNSIVSLLAGDLGVGQPLPMAYNVYNVPLAYRANYYDTPDAWYRYNDGYIYRVDPTTHLITAVIDALI
jgi:hypothetical protein